MPVEISTLERVGKAIQKQCVNIYEMFSPKENTEITREWVGGEILKYLRECRTYGMIDNASIFAENETDLPFFNVYVKLPGITEVFNFWVGDEDDVKALAEKEDALNTVEVE